MSDKPKRRGMTEAQKKARLDNLAKGRQKRAEMAKLKKETPEYDIESESDSSSDSSSDSDAFILSKKKLNHQSVLENQNQAHEKKNHKRNLTTLFVGTKWMKRNDVVKK